MRSIAALLLVFAAATSLRADSADLGSRGGKVTWRTDAVAALAAAKSAGRRSFVFFTHDRCECGHVEREAKLFSDDAVAAATKAFTCIFVNVESGPDLDAAKELAKAFGVRGYPTALILDQTGKIICEANTDASRLAASLRDHALADPSLVERPGGALTSPEAPPVTPRVLTDFLDERAQRLSDPDARVRERAKAELETLKRDVERALQGQRGAAVVQLTVFAHDKRTVDGFTVEFGCVGERQLWLRIASRTEPARAVLEGASGAKLELRPTLGEWTRAELPAAFGRPVSLVIHPRG